VVAGLLYVLSLVFAGTPWLSVTILLLGRALLGGAESFVITGAVTWGLGLAGHENAGRVIAWVGMAMFAALAVGAPLGTALYAAGGFTAVATATALVPLVTVLLAVRLSEIPAQGGARAGLMTVIGAVWLPGFGSALSSVGFGAMIAFSSLLAAERGWSPVWLTFSAFALALVAARLFLGHLPDSLGGARVALACVFVEAAGLALIWFAAGPALAAAGAALTGFGYSLAFPALCLEAVRRVPPQSRGSAIGAYVVCLDFSLASAGPVAGLMVAPLGYPAIYLLGGACAVLAALLTIGLLREETVPSPSAV
jgi:predicted MFS family arabinose efflux permease